MCVSPHGSTCRPVEVCYPISCCKIRVKPARRIARHHYCRHCHVVVGSPVGFCWPVRVLHWTPTSRAKHDVYAPADSRRMWLQCTRCISNPAFADTCTLICACVRPRCAPDRLTAVLGAFRRSGGRNNVRRWSRCHPFQALHSVIIHWAPHHCCCCSGSHAYGSALRLSYR